MMVAIQFIVVVLFFLKILWNILTPFVFLNRSFANSSKTTGISMAPLVEVGLWLLLILISFLTDGSNWLNSPKKVVIWGIATILGSYVALVPLGWLVAYIKKHLGATTPRH
jgi:hypothetical protein